MYHYRQCKPRTWQDRLHTVLLGACEAGELPAGSVALERSLQAGSAYIHSSGSGVPRPECPARTKLQLQGGAGGVHSAGGAERGAARLNTTQLQLL